MLAARGPEPPHGEVGTCHAYFVTVSKVNSVETLSEQMGSFRHTNLSVANCERGELWRNRT